jgi:hypothetical protein
MPSEAAARGLALLVGAERVLAVTDVDAGDLNFRL